MKQHFSLRWRRRRNGVALSEFAIVLSLLVTVMMLCIDFGRYVHSYIALSNAVRAGAEYAMTHPVSAASQTDWQNGIRDAMEDELQGNSWFTDPNDLTIPTAPVAVDDGSGFTRVSLSAQYPFTPVLSWWPGYSSTRTMTRSLVVRQIR